MNYGVIKKTDIANGPGVRVSLFVSGCRNHCKGCFNPETWDFNYGKTFDRETKDEIIQALSPYYISGLSLLGGDPFEPENQLVLVDFVKEVKSLYPDKTIWCWTGYKFEESLVSTAELLKYIDVLVDGKFEQELKNITLKFQGSENQRVISVPESIKEEKTILLGGY